MQLNIVSRFVSIFGQPKTSLILLLFCESTETSEQLLSDTLPQYIICHQMCISAACQISVICGCHLNQQVQICLYEKYQNWQLC